MNVLKAITKAKFRPWLIYLIYICIGLVSFFGNPLEVAFGDNYTGMARNIIEGRGLSDPSVPKQHRDIPQNSLQHFLNDYDFTFGTLRPNVPTAFWLPAYPLWLGLWFYLFGLNHPLVNIVQLFLMGLVIPLISYIGRNSYGERIGFYAGIFILTHFYILRFPHSFGSENLFIPLFIGGIGAWYWCRKSPSISRVLILSLIWALAGLTRTVGIYLTLFVLLTLFVSTPKSRKYILYSIGLMVLLWGGWMYRNSIAVGTPTLLPTKHGYNLWLENNSNYIGRDKMGMTKLLRRPYTIPPENAEFLKQKFGFDDDEIREMRRYDYPEELVDASEVEIDKVLKSRFYLFLKEHPFKVIQYSADRLLYSFTENLTALKARNIHFFISIYFTLFFLFSITGLTISVVKFKSNWFLVSISLLYILLMSGGVGGFRFRVPLDPVLAIFAGLSLTIVIDRVVRWRRLKID